MEIDIRTPFLRRLSHTSRHILLLMDNAGCHPNDLATKLFLPAPQKSNLWIWALYKSIIGFFFLRYVLSKIDECETASEVVNTLMVTVAIWRLHGSEANKKFIISARDFRLVPEPFYFQ